jgi:tetratricopeptide (TPR) repeat protein/type II secretory pathway predicted ATPase ExeA
LEKAEAHAPEAIAVTGQGGAGKTRFCQEIGYLAEQRGAVFLSISHPQDLEHPYKIFGLLAQDILSNPFDRINPKDALESYILSLHPKLFQRAKGTIATIFSSESRSCGAFDREAMIQLLLVMLLHKTKLALHILHFSDLHWASAETLEILGELLQRLRKMATDYRAAVLFLFEGRVQTQLKHTAQQNIRGQVSSTAIFESFVDRYQLERFDVRPFSSTQSRGFLKHLFENAQSANRRVPEELIPHQEVLIEEIARYGQGNPFHMVEQIKLLKQEGLLARNQRTGLIFLNGTPKASYQVPTSVFELISLRLKFIEESEPELWLLIKSIGLIKDRISAQLFHNLHRRLASHTPDSAIHEIEILNTENPSEISFRHENYYHVVQGSTLSPSERRKVTDLYLDWYRALRPKTAEVLYEEALIHTNRLRVKMPVVKRLLTNGLMKAEACHQYQLAIQIIEKYLQTFPPEVTGASRPFLSLLANLKLRIKLADFSNDLHGWNLGAEQLERVIADIDRYLQKEAKVSPTSRSTLKYLRTTSMVELANSKSDLGRAHESVRLLTEARKICESHFALGILTNAKELEKWNKLYGRLLNRLGEANWMDGNYAEAIRALEEATSVIEETIQGANERQLLHHINLLDYGAVLLHKDPSKAVEILKKSRSLIPGKGWSPHYEILASTTVLIGEMVELFLQESSNSPRFRQYLESSALPQLQQDFEKALFYGFKQEQVAASLMMGICLSLLDDRKARQWYMESIEISFRSNNLESLWRGHLNLAQYLASSGELEGSIFHCNRARQLISRDIRERAPHERRWRQRHLRHPLMRIACLLPESELMADPFISTVLEEIKEDSGEESQLITPSFFCDKIIYLWDQSNEFYPYGG